MRRTLTLAALVLLGCPQDPAPLGNTAPSAVISAPDDGAVVWVGDDLAVTGGIADAESPAAAMEVAWSSSLDGALGGGTGDGAGAVAIEFVPQTAGSHAITLTVTDADGATASDAITVVAQTNTAPTIALQSPPFGQEFLTTDAVPVRAFVNDATHDAESLTVTFSSSLGGPLTGSTGADAKGISEWSGTLAAGVHVITARVEDPRGLQDQDTVQITVGDADGAPTCSVAVPGLGIYNDTDAVPLLGQVGDAEDAADSLGILWESSIDGTVDTTPASATGALTGSASALTPGLHTFTLTVTDSAGQTCTNSDLELRVNGTPIPPVVAIDPATPSTTDILTLVVLTAAGDPDGDALATSIAWLRNGTAQAAWAGQTTVLPADTNGGETWTVEVSVADATATASAAPASVTIGNGAPSVSAPILGPALLYTDTTASCTVGATSDPDGDPVTVDIAWEVDSAAVSGQTAVTLSGGSWFEKDQTVACVTTPDDGSASGAPVSSVVLTVQNSAPSAPQITISPSIPSPSVGLTCLISGAATDPDAADVASLVLNYSWLVDGSPAGIPDPIVPSSATAAGEVWTCEVSAEDQDGATSAPASTSVQICAPQTWYEDFDGDGFGNLNVTQSTCPAPGAGWVQNADDCNDANIGIYPEAGDTYGDGVDGDCDGEANCEAGVYLGTYFALCLPGGTFDFLDADAECQALGYDGLASVRSQLEQDSLWLLFQASGQQNSANAYIGTTDELVEGSWGWLDGSPPAYANWSSGEPNGGTSENCGHLNWPQGSGGWNDTQCGWGAPAFICQTR